MRLIDRDEMLSPKIWDMSIPIDIPKKFYDSLFELYNRLIHIPTVDAEPVIRCKNCKYWAEFTFNNPPFHYCGRLFQDGNTESIGFYMEEDDFCSKGEKK